MNHVFSLVAIIAALAAVLFASHFFLYYSLVHFFKITSPAINTTLAIILVFLAISFIMASFLAHWRENVITRTFYFSSGLWLGVLVNLLMAFIFLWIIWGVMYLLHIPMNSGLIAFIAILIAFVYSSWGVYCAYNPIIKKVSVNINNLPDQWKGKKIVQISDIHLGHVYNSNFLSKIINQINLLSPDLVLITGDLFDGMDGNLDLHLEPMDQLKTNYGVYFINGNHELYYGLEKAANLLAKTQVKILSDEIVEIDGLRLLGLNYADRFEDRDLALSIKEIIADQPRLPTILMYHSPDQIEQIKKIDLVDLHLTGHTHGGQLYPFNWITKIVFKGYDYGLYKYKNYNLYTTSGVGAWGPTMRTGYRSEIVLITLE